MSTKIATRWLSSRILNRFSFVFRNFCCHNFWLLYTLALIVSGNCALELIIYILHIHWIRTLIRIEHIFEKCPRFDWCCRCESYFWQNVRSTSHDKFPSHPSPFAFIYLNFKQILSKTGQQTKTQQKINKNTDTWHWQASIANPFSIFFIYIAWVQCSVFTAIAIVILFPISLQFIDVSQIKYTVERFIFCTLHAMDRIIFSLSLSLSVFLYLSRLTQYTKCFNWTFHEQLAVRSVHSSRMLFRFY